MRRRILAWNTLRIAPWRHRRFYLAIRSSLLQSIKPVRLVFAAIRHGAISNGRSPQGIWPWIMSAKSWS
jgi:hypothetical protein